MAVTSSTEPYFIIGQDILGGRSSLLRSLNNSDFCCILVVDNATGNIGTIHYIKNVEHTLLPVVKAAATEPKGV